MDDDNEVDKPVLRATSAYKLPLTDDQKVTLAFASQGYLVPELSAADRSRAIELVSDDGNCDPAVRDFVYGVIIASKE